MFDIYIIKELFEPFKACITTRSHHVSNVHDTLQQSTGSSFFTVSYWHEPHALKRLVHQFLPHHNHNTASATTQHLLDASQSLHCISNYPAPSRPTVSNIRPAGHNPAHQAFLSGPRGLPEMSNMIDLCLSGVFFKL